MAAPASANVSSVHRVLGGCRDDPKEARAAPPITKDLLGGSNLDANHCSQELDLDLHVPFGWEKRLDLKSGRVYLQRCNSPNSLDHKQHLPTLQDLNFPPSPSRPSPNLLDDSSSLQLKLVSSSPPAYQSVCTLDKVKSALQRAEREPVRRKRSAWWNSPCASSPINDVEEGEEERSPVAAGCPGCLSYVMVVRSRPQCPRCGTLVPLPAEKKPCIDLNISI